MDYARIARPELEGARQAILAQLRWDHEDSINVGPIGRDLVLFGHGEHEIRLSQLPAGNEMRRRRKVGWIAAWGSISDPGGDAFDVAGIQAPFVEKPAESSPGPPGRHDSLFDHRRDLRGPVADLFVACQRKRSALTLAMAAHAVGKNDRRDVATECQLLRGHVDIGWLDQTSDRLRSRELPLVPRRDLPQHVPQVLMRHSLAGAADCRVTVIDPAAVDDGTAVIDDDCLRCMGWSQLSTKAPGRVQEQRKSQLIRPPVIRCLSGGRLTVDDHAVKLDVPRCTGRLQPVELRQIGIADGAMGRQKNEDRRDSDFALSGMSQHSVDVDNWRKRNRLDGWKRVKRCGSVGQLGAAWHCGARYVAEQVLRRSVGSSNPPGEPHAHHK